MTESETVLFRNKDKNIKYKFAFIVELLFWKMIARVSKKNWRKGD